MNCIDLNIGKLIARYELNLLSPEEKTVFETHLLECDFCYQDCYSMSQAFEVMQNRKNPY